jgi:hypothetical protein
MGLTAYADSRLDSVAAADHRYEIRADVAASALERTEQGNATTETTR